MILSFHDNVYKISNTDNADVKRIMQFKIHDRSALLPTPVSVYKYPMFEQVALYQHQCSSSDMAQPKSYI